MPLYQAIEPGFYDSCLYSPNSSREYLETDKPLNPCPSWLKPVSAPVTKVAEEPVDFLTQHTQLKKQIDDKNIVEVL